MGNQNTTQTQLLSDSPERIELKSLISELITHI